MLSIAEWQRELHQTAIERGWYDRVDLNPERIVVHLALIHTEVSEAVECVRNGQFDERHDESGKPIGLPSELADIAIRLLDTAEALGIDLERAISEKNEYHKRRPYRHGCKRF